MPHFSRHGKLGKFCVSFEGDDSDWTNRNENVRYNFKNTVREISWIFLFSLIFIREIRSRGNFDRDCRFIEEWLKFEIIPMNFYARIEGLVSIPDCLWWMILHLCFMFCILFKGYLRNLEQGLISIFARDFWNVWGCLEFVVVVGNFSELF